MASIITVYKGNENIFKEIKLRHTSRYAFHVVFPNSFSKDKKYKIVLWGLGSNSGMTYAEMIKETREGEADFISEYSDPFEIIIVIPVLPRDDGNATRPPLDTQMLSYFTMIHNFDDFYYRPDLEILEFLTIFRKSLKNAGYTLESSNLAGGISAGASIADRLLLLHPVDFSASAILSAGVFSYPIKEIEGVKLPYPFGIGDLDEISNEFDINKFNNIRRFIYVGELETNNEHDSLRYETSHDGSLYKTILENYGKNPYERTSHYHNFLLENNIVHEFEIGKNLGHHVSRETLKRVFQFLTQNCK
jgi:predicted esterase